MTFGDAAISVLGDCPIDQGWVAVGFRRRAPWACDFSLLFKKITAEQAGAPGDTTNTQALKMARTCSRT